jgi:hypothetical protein
VSAQRGAMKAHTVNRKLDSENTYQLGRRRLEPDISSRPVMIRRLVQRVMSMPEKDQAASFAKAITRDEFGRFYWDDRSEGEVRRSLASAMARIKAERRARAKLAKAKK